MNEQTLKLIEQLAQKLGTTSEYLWSVLLKQAPIDATTTLLQFLCIVIFGIVLLKIHFWLAKPEKDERNSRYYNSDGVYQGVMFACVIIFGILFIMTFCCLGDVVNGYFNPEYWALQHILQYCK